MRKLLLIAITLAAIGPPLLAVAQAQEEQRFSAAIGAVFRQDSRPAGGAVLLTRLSKNFYSFSGFTVTGTDEQKAIYGFEEGFLIKAQDTERLDVYFKAIGGVAEDPETVRPDYAVGPLLAFRLFKSRPFEIVTGVLLADSQSSGGVGFRIPLAFSFGGN